MELKIFSFSYAFLHYYTIIITLLHYYYTVEVAYIVMVVPLLKKMEKLHPTTCCYTETCLQHR